MLSGSAAEITQFDDPENPTMLDQFVENLGAEVVDWPAKVDCCAGSLAFGGWTWRKKCSATSCNRPSMPGANCIVAACPLCQANLDTRTPMSSKKALPILYFSELLALALGNTKMMKWWNRHIFRPTKLLKSLDLL